MLNPKVNPLGVIILHVWMKNVLCFVCLPIEKDHQNKIFHEKNYSIISIDTDDNNYLINELLDQYVESIYSHNHCYITLHTMFRLFLFVYGILLIRYQHNLTSCITFQHQSLILCQIDLTLKHVYCTMWHKHET